jgi:hypothetical protein
MPRTLGGAGKVLCRQLRFFAPLPAPGLARNDPGPPRAAPRPPRGCVVSLQLCMLCTGHAFFARRVWDTPCKELGRLAKSGPDDARATKDRALKAEQKVDPIAKRAKGQRGPRDSLPESRQPWDFGNKGGRLPSAHFLASARTTSSGSGSRPDSSVGIRGGQITPQSLPGRPFPDFREWTSNQAARAETLSCPPLP